MLIKEFMKLPVVMCVSLYFIPMRYFVVMGLWGAILSNSPFCASLFAILVKKGIKVADFLIEKSIEIFLRRKDYKIAQLIEFPFSHFFHTIKGYLARRFERRLKKIESSQRVRSVSEDK